MIYCPHCGTPNKPSSKFCKNCAALLAPSTDVRCPICGTMNAQGATACINCGTRLNTGSAGAMNSNDRTTPADTPEQISPFNPPASRENQEPETTDTPPVNRPSFARANSEWLRRIQKSPASEPRSEPTPSPAPPAAVETAATPATDQASISASPPAIADWLQAPETEPADITSLVSSPTSTEIEPPAKAVLSEIKLTGDDYAYSDIGGELTDEMKAHIKASASNLISTEDEVALARRLLGLDTSTNELPAPIEPAAPPQPPTFVESQPPARVAPMAPPGFLASQPPPKTLLSEIKLTRDDYDYSDIGGQVTDEMKAQLEASASNFSTTEDEVELARRLLGLDTSVGETAAPIAPTQAPTFIESEPPARVAPMAPPGFVASQPPPKTLLSEIKLTGDDYDYSDIGGQVTDDMKAQLESGASSLTTTEDEVALARRLLGLDVETSSIVAAAPLEPVAMPNSAPLAGEPMAVQDMASVATEDVSVADSAPTFTEPTAEIEIPVVAAPVVSETLASAPIEPLLPLEIPPTLVAEPTPQKPVLAEIKLTGDDYDYSDIGGQVTDDIKAQLAASVSNLTSTDDEVALARRLLGLDVAEPTLPAATATPSIETQPATQAESPAWLTALAAASSAAVAGQVEYAQTPQPTAELSPADELASEQVMPVELPPQAEPVATLQDVVASQPLETPIETSVTGPITAIQAAAPTSLQEASAEIPATAEPIATQVPSSPAVSTKPGLESGQLPEWLREFAPPEIVARDSVVETAAVAEALSTDDEGPLPEWVKELAPKGEQAGATTMFTPLPDLDETERGELPDWLREPPAPVEPIAPPTPVALETTPSDDEPAADETLSDEPPRRGTRVTPDLVPALELPSWFTNGKSGANPLRDPFEPIETTGPLAGVSGILPLAVAITEPHLLTTPMPTRSDGGRIFQTILAEPLSVSARASTQARPTSLFQPKHILYLVILFAALIPLFFGLDQSGLGLDATKSSSAGFYDQLQSVPANGTVLLAFDYSPGQAVELDPAARVIVNTLAKRGVNVIAVSTSETGPTIAQDILERAQIAQPTFTFVNVGYIFGKEATVSGFAQGWLKSTQPLLNGSTWGASPLARTTQGMNDLGLTILFSPDADDLALWMQQAQPHVTSPIVAATSAQVEPQARNYVNAKQLQASLRGLTGAAELELLTNSAGRAVKTVDALSLVSLALAGIIIATNVIAFLKRGKTK